MNSPQRECLVKDYSDVTLESYILCAALFINPSERNLVSRGRALVFAAEVCALHVGIRVLAQRVCAQAVAGLQRADLRA